MNAQVLIGCKLPQGITVKINAYDNSDDARKITLNGMNTSLVTGGHGITSVDKDDADMFMTTHKDFAPVLAGTIFTHGTDAVADLIDMAVDLSEEKTGFEGMDPSKPAPGLLEEESSAKQRAKTAANLPPVRAPGDKASKAATKAAAVATKV